MPTTKAQKRSKDIAKIVHVTSGVQLQFYKATRILFVLKKTYINIIYSAILYPELPSSGILESTPERMRQCVVELNLYYKIGLTTNL